MRLGPKTLWLKISGPYMGCLSPYTKEKETKKEKRKKSNIISP